MASRIKEMVGFVSGRLTVTGLAGVSASGSAMWKCACECGGSVTALGANLRRGRPESCGCLRIERVRQSLGTHLRSRSREYAAWRGMRHRCANPRAKSYRNYGGRGIRVAPEWDTSFERFFADMGPAPDGWSLDRIDNDGNYEPGNCRWASNSTQHRNTRRTHLIEFAGQSLCITDWASKLGISVRALRDRLAKQPIADIVAQAGARELSGGVR